MATSRPRKTRSTSIHSKAAEMAVAVPQVMAHRLTRMALAGSPLSARDQKEFKLMVAEKNHAFAQSWQAMMTASLRANQQMAATMFGALWSPYTWGRPVSSKLSAQVRRAAADIVAQGLAPVHGKAVANAKRLGRTSLR